MELINKILDFELIHAGEYTIRVMTLVLVIFILALTKAILWLII